MAVAPLVFCRATARWNYRHRFWRRILL